MALTVVLAGIPFALGKYFEFNSPDAFDSACYVYSAQKILSGAEIGVEEKPSAQLGTLLVNLLGVRLFGFSETGPKSIQMVMQLAALVLMYLAMRKLFGNLAAGVGVVLASFYLSAPLIAKVGNVKEQYMIACMLAGVSCLVLYQLNARWWIALIAGALISWAPLFKPTGVSAMTAVGLFLLIQPVIKARTWRQVGQDVLLLVAGALLPLAPVYVWIFGWQVHMDPPYAFVVQALGKIVPIGTPADGASNAADYVIQSRKMMPFDQQVARIMGNYKLLLLPILLAAGALVAGIGRAVYRLLVRKSTDSMPCGRFLVLFATWWLLDMAFVWISPRSYIQYYLPLTASAAMLTGYLLAPYSQMLTATFLKARWNVLCLWIVVGMFGALLVLVLAWEPLCGMRQIPSRYSYAEKLKEISDRKKGESIGYWERAGEYVGSNTQSGDTIYVWGWFPGIYVKAQRLSSAPKAFEGTMHTLPPEELANRVQELLGAFKKEPPMFIVDSKKVHFPWNRPPLELWPQTRQGFLPAEEDAIRRYDAAYGRYLRENIAPDEAERYAAMKPFRDYVMANYEIAEPGQFVRLQDGRQVHKMFGAHVVFKRK